MDTHRWRYGTSDAYTDGDRHIHTRTLKHKWRHTISDLHMDIQTDKTEIFKEKITDGEKERERKRKEGRADSGGGEREAERERTQSSKGPHRTAHPGL